VNSSFALGINTRRWIVGFSENGIIDPQTLLPETAAVLWRNGQIINLGTLGGTQGVAAAINTRGQIAGAAQNKVLDAFSTGFDQIVGPTSPFSGLTQWRAFLWDGTMKDLGTLGGPDSAANVMNERGQVAGESYTNSTPNTTTGRPTLDPFLWENGRMLDLGSLGGTLGFANWLNTRGQVVGQSNLTGDQTFHPFLWSKSGGMQDLGTLGGKTGTALWVNELGAVVGYADVPGQSPQVHHAFLWRHGVMTDLEAAAPNTCGRAVFINNRGQVVGTVGPKCGSQSYGFLWEPGGPIIDLNTLIPPGSGLRVTWGLDINDRGEIAGLGVTPQWRTARHPADPG
jgi:probable HAF family extracellular repeat protein